MARGTRKQRDQHRPSAVDAPGSDRPRPCGAATPRDHRRYRQVRRLRSAVLPRVGARQSGEDADGNLAATARLGGRALRRAPQCRGRHQLRRAARRGQGAPARCGRCACRSRSGGTLQSHPHIGIAGDRAGGIGRAIDGGRCGRRHAGRRTLSGRALGRRSVGGEASRGRPQGYRVGGAFPRVAGKTKTEGMNMSAGTKFREILAKNGLVEAMAAHSPLSAMLAAEAGFDAIWASGFELSSMYGVPDVSIVSMTQHLDMTRAMAERSGLPVVADIDTGFGNSINVLYAVEQYERAGVAAIVMEDKSFPKVSSLIAGGRQDMVRIEEFQGKIESARSVRKDKNLVLVARTEALIAGLGQDEALKRARAYEAAGAEIGRASCR